MNGIVKQVYGLAVEVYPPEGREFPVSLQNDLDERIVEIGDIQKQVLRRQKQKELRRVDLLTYIEQTAKRLQREPLWRDIAPALDEIDKQELGEAGGALFKCLYFKGMTTTIAMQRPGQPKPQAGVIRPWDGMPVGKNDLLYPVYQLHLPNDSSLQKEEFTADLMLMLIAMVEAREAVVQYSITRRPKLARCALGDCRSWFELPFISGRSRFCSDNCRINHLRRGRKSS